MAKRQKGKKKKRSSTRSQSQARSSSGGGSLKKKMAQVRVLYQAEAYEEAFELLLRINKKYPRRAMVLSALTDVAVELNNLKAVAIYSEQLYPMESGDERATTLNNLINVYIKLMLPALAWKTTSILMADHPNFHSIEQAKQLAQQLKPVLFDSFSQLDLLTERFADDQEAMLDFMVEHDQMRFLAESNQNKEAILSCQRLLDKLPGFIPALNNISLAHFIEGEIDKAIDATQKVLAQQPNNYHALANLARYSFLMGETEAASSYATQLKQVENNEFQRWVKQAEALAYLGDDEGVRYAYLESEEYDSQESPILLHLAAAAHYRLGYDVMAWQLWQEALQISPSFDMAKASLAERSKAPGEQDVGWYWPLTYWFAGDFARSYMSFSGPSSRKGAAKKAGQKLLKQYPQLPRLLPHILDRGDPHARKTMLLFIDMMKTEELAQGLLPFGYGKSGTDAQRMEAFQLISQHYPDLLPPDRKVTVWQRGEQTEIMMMAFAVSDEPEGTILDNKTYNLYEQANDYLVERRNLKRAEEIYLKVIDAYPDFPSAYHHLALLYERQGRHKQSRKQVEQTHHRFPDYTFARIALARMAVQEKELEKAREYLNPVLQLRELHTSEFRALAQAEIEYALAMELPESARVWLSMWKQIEDHPSQLNWQIRIEGKNGPDEMRRLMQKFLQDKGK